MKNRTFPSVGGPCQFDTEGNRESVYAVIAVTDEIASFEASNYFLVVLIFPTNNSLHLFELFLGGLSF